MKKVVEVVFRDDACEEHRYSEFGNEIARYLSWKCDKCKSRKWEVEEC